MFMKGKTCELRPIEISDYEVNRYTNFVNAGWTLEYVFTGSFPLRPIDVRESWESCLKSQGREILLGIWTIDPDYIVQGFPPKWKLVGACGLYSYREVYQSREFRIIIFDHEAVGKGVGTEVTQLVIDYFFRRLNGYKLWLGVNAENVRAIKCYEKAGYKREGGCGVLEKEIYVNGKYVDVIRMRILREEWLQNIAQSS